MHYANDINRVCRLSLGCTSLTMSLTPCFLLLPYVRKASLKTVAFVMLAIGMMFPVSKSIFLATPGVRVYLWQEQHRRQILVLTVRAMMVMSIGIIVTMDWNCCGRKLATLQSTESTGWIILQEPFEPNLRSLRFFPGLLSVWSWRD